MRRWWKWTVLPACGAVFLSLFGGLPLAAQSPQAPLPWTGIGPPPGLVPPCDQYDPYSPVGSARITLDSHDLVHRGGGGGRGGEMRSFIETGSLGRVDFVVVRATPADAVAGISAVPEISRISPYFGERLKGIALDVALVSVEDKRAEVVLDLRQVCAWHFRNTFLHY